MYFPTSKKIWMKYNPIPSPRWMISFKLDGSEYISIVEIPDIGIELPVMSEWSYPNLKIAPCWYEGNPATKNMIIAAHNYRSHFGRIGDLSSDSEIIFIDVMGKTYHYEVVNIEQIAGTAIEKMEFGSAEDWDLTLFMRSVIPLINPMKNSRTNKNRKFSFQLPNFVPL